MVYAKNSTPLREPFVDAINTDEQRISLVGPLSYIVSPSAIFKEISLHGVYSVKRSSGRPRPHVLKKALKCQPFVANLYAFCAIIFVGFNIRVKASTFHHAPRIVFGRFCHAMRFTGEKRPIHTSTRPGLTRNYRELKDMRNSAAIANENPFSL